MSSIHSHPTERFQKIEVAPPPKKRGRLLLVFGAVLLGIASLGGFIIWQTANGISLSEIFKMTKKQEVFTPVVDPPKPTLTPTATKTPLPKNGALVGLKPTPTQTPLSSYSGWFLHKVNSALGGETDEATPLATALATPVD